jgi:hypothetical protein
METELKLHVPEEKVMSTVKATVSVAKEKPLLAGYGMDANYFSTVEGEIQAAAGFKSDRQITSELKNSTQLKNAKLKEAGIWGNKVKTRLELAFPKNPEIAAEFPSDFIKAKRDEATMIEVIPEITKLIDKYAVQLKAKGLPDDHKQKGEAILAELDAANTEQEKLKKLGPDYTQQRIAAYVKIYDRVNEINKAGREAYADSPADLKAFRSPWPAAEKKSDKEAKKKDETKSSDEKNS